MFLSVLKSGNSLKEQTDKNDKTNYQKRRRHGCNFIKKEENKYTLAKYATLHKSFLIFNNQLQKLLLPPQKGAATVVFGRKVSQDSSQFSIQIKLFFKSIFNSNQTFLLPCDVVVPLHNLFSLIC